MYTSGQPWSNKDGEYELYGLIPDTEIVLQAELDDGSLSEPVTVNVPPGSMLENVTVQFR